MDKKVFIGLVEHMGDIVACEPITRRMKEKYPSHKICWVGKSIYKEILETNPNIDEVIYVNCLTEWIILSKHQKDSVIVDLHVNFRECECCRVPLYKSKYNSLVTIQNWYDFGSLLNAFSIGAGVESFNDHPNVYIQDINKTKIDSLSLKQKFVVIHRNSNDSARDWNNRKWKKLVELLIGNNLLVIDVGSESQCNNITVNGNYLDLRGKLSILDTAELISRAELFIGIDSGPAHLANAVKAKSVILLGVFGNFKKYHPYSGLYSSEGPNLRIVRNLNGPASDIEVADVFDAINYIIDHPQSIVDKNIFHSYFEQKFTVEKNGEIKVIAFYLPQFYPTPENNHAWGDGFVEWSNIIKAKPLFKNHNQPIEPGELGYYDLRSQEILEEQAELANAYGINAFSFYYYYSAGKRLLSRPLHNFMHSNIDMNFCITFANHNWTKKWDAGDQEVIFEQHHDDHSNEYFIDSVIEIFRDKRYIKVNGKPLLLIFMPQLFPNIKKTTELWREKVLDQGFPGLYLVMVDDWNRNLVNPKDYGFDATYEMPSNFFNEIEDISKTLDGLDESFTGRIIQYKELSDYFIGRPFPIYKRFKTIMAPWDNTPRYKSRAIVTLAPSLKDLQNWVTAAIVDTCQRYSGDERIVFVHSWNEWAEGTFIEPDKLNKRNRLAAVKRGIEDAREIISHTENNSNAVSRLIELMSIKNESIYRYDALTRNMAAELSYIRHYTDKMKNYAYKYLSKSNLNRLKRIFNLFKKYKEKIQK